MQADTGLQRGRPGSEIVDGGARSAGSRSRAGSQKGIEEAGEEEKRGWIIVGLQRETVGQGTKRQQLFGDRTVEHQRPNVETVLRREPGFRSLWQALRRLGYILQIAEPAQMPPRDVVLR